MTPEMTLARFRDLVDAFGAAEERWPATERAAAAALCARSAEARALRAAADERDRLLDRAPAAAASPALAQRVLAAAPAARRRGSKRRARTWGAAAGVASLAAAAAIAFWVVRAPEQVTPSPILYAVADPAAFETPTDVLLGSDALDASLPALACTGSGTDSDLGCADFEPLLDQQSPRSSKRGDSPRRMHA
jgi:hypothetical protein